MAQFIVDTLQGLSNQRQRPILVFLVPNEAISNSHVYKIEHLIRTIPQGPLDIVIHSGGGSAHAAFKIGDLLLKKSNNNLGIFIPCRAKSAATLIAIIGKEIYFGPTAELGPLDTQISERTKEGGKSGSALDPFKAVEQITQSSLEATDIMIGMLLNKSGITMTEAFHHGIDFGTKLSNPLFGQIDPIQLGGYSRALAIGSEYGIRLLTRSNNLAVGKNPNDIVHSLVYDYPSHDFIIDSEELKRQGFPVMLPEGELSGIIGALADGVAEYVYKSQQTIIDLVNPQAPIEVQAEAPIENEIPELVQEN